ncbi:MAG: CinA family protein [Verrucomicrobiales bacterium]|nr:CinA family protein [Verrucomicrobiales bacterium]
MARASLRLAALFIARLVAAFPPVMAGEPVAAADPSPQDFAIVVTGGELLRGLYPDGHTAFLTRLLRPLGLQCVGSICVDDRDADLRAALAFASERAGLVIVTGGLGPTDDDITRQTLASVTGVPLRESPELLDEMARRFGGESGQLAGNLRRQTLVPESGRWLKNIHGTAAGLVFDLGDRVVVALPGPPRELQPMARTELVPFLQGRFGLRTFGCSVTLRFVGVGESRIDQTLHSEIALPEGLAISSIFEGGRVDVTYSLPGHAEADRANLAGLVEAIRARLGKHIYATGEDSLEAVVLERVRRAGGGLLLAECGTGGILAEELLGEPVAIQALSGACIAPDLTALRRLLGLTDPAPNTDATGEAAVRELCVAALRSRGAGLVCVSGEAGETSGGLGVWCALGTDGRVLSTRRFPSGGRGSGARASLASSVLDWLRTSLPEAGASPGEGSEG